MRLTIILALLIASGSACGTTKCRSGTKIVYLNDVCPAGYTDITGQEHGENFGIKPILTPQQREAAERKRLEAWGRENLARRKDTQAEMEQLEREIRKNNTLHPLKQ